MPNDRETTSSSPSRGRAGDGKAAQRTGFLSAVGVGFAWIVVMAVWQKGLSGYLFVFLLLYAVLALVGAMALARHAFQHYAMPICAFSLLGVWWGIGGTYSWRRDAVLGTVVFLAVLVAFPSSRLWLRRLPLRLRALWRLWRTRRRYEASDAGRFERTENARRLGEAFKRGVGSFWVRLRTTSERDDGEPGTAAQSPGRRPVRPALSPLTIALAALAVWITGGVADRMFESRPLPRAGGVKHPPAMAAAYAPLNVGLAMSGGGYRAALVHAGVVDALGSLGIPVTHISAVSGGAIIGSYLAVGGTPGEFLDAVIVGRFRMARDLLAAPNLVRLPSPTVVPELGVDLWPFFGNFSRIDVQANLVDRVLLDGTAANVQLGPRLMIGMTDLNHGLSVGATDDGVLLAGPTAARYFRNAQGIEFPAMPRLADRVAVSGAFPGAFPPLAVQTKIARWPETKDVANEGMDLHMLLADGGVRDNLGLTLLEAMDRLARNPDAEPGGSTWRGFQPDADWKLDVVLVSDGGKFLQAEFPTGLLGPTMRAIDLSGLATGVMRPMNVTAEDRLVVLSALSVIAPGPDAVVLGMGTAALRDAHYAYFRPDTLGDDVVDRILALQSDPERMRSAWRTHRQRGASSINLTRAAAECPAAAETAVDADCAWWSVVSQVGEDIWRATQVFAQTPTLSDAYSADQAQTIFRFGQYLVYLQAPKLRHALAKASERRGMPAG